jgi:hemoglobin
MKEFLSDINSREDIKKFLAVFYQKAQQDDIIGEKFKNIKMDEHIELIADFWGTILFGTSRYHGNPFEKHIPMALAESHLTR